MVPHNENARCFVKPLRSSRRINAFDVSSLRNLEWLHYISSPPPFLKNLTLEGCIKEIDWLREFTHLVKIHLFGSKLKEGKTVQILGELPNLMVLQLRWGAYVGVKLLFRAEAFPKLRKLEIRFLEDLREMRFEERTSPQMETIEISHCRLESGIIGIKHLPKLKEISLRWNCEVARLGQLLEEVKANPNRPVLLLYNDPSKHEGTPKKGQVHQWKQMNPRRMWTRARNPTKVKMMMTTSNRLVLHGMCYLFFSSVV